MRVRRNCEERPPIISVVIPTRNEAHNLPRLLTSIERQALPHEVVVVDQKSDDGTVEIATRFGARVLSVERSLFYSPPSRSRNQGANEARGSILVHLDADMEIASETLFLELAEAFSTGARAAIIHEEDVPQGFWNRVKAIERRCYWGTPIESARVIDRQLFQELGGYDSAISSGEDFELQARIVRNVEIFESPTLMLLHHTGSTSLRQLLRKKFLYGRTVDRYLERASDINAVSGVSMILLILTAVGRQWREGLRQPLAYSCVLPLRAAEMLALLSGSLAERMKWG